MELLRFLIIPAGGALNEIEFDEVEANAVKLHWASGYGSGYNGSFYTYSAGVNINNLNFTHLVEYSGGKITEDIKFPISPSEGDLHLQVNQSPLKPYLRESSGWEEKQFVKIGQVQKISGLLGTPISYAFNSRAIITLNVSTNQASILNHNIGVNFNFINWLGVHNDITTSTSHANLPNGTDGVSLETGTGLGGTCIIDPTNLTMTLKTMSASIGQMRNINIMSSTAVLNFWRNF